ncbi:MAG: hypothetical protein HXS48_19260 [Theionarchaea archaeon]|nr:hypothetical protein [Theionarchaea archaeon]
MEKEYKFSFSNSYSLHPVQQRELLEMKVKPRRTGGVKNAHQGKECDQEIPASLPNDL